MKTTTAYALELSRTLAAARKAGAKTATLAVTDDGRLTLATLPAQIGDSASIVAHLTFRGWGDPWALSVDCAALKKLLARAKKEETVELVGSADPHRLTVTFRGATSTLPCSPASVGPAHGTGTSLGMLDVGNKALAWVGTAASRDDTRPALMGVHVRPTSTHDGFTFLDGTDGHRLHQASLGIEQGWRGTKQAEPFTLGSAALATAQALAKAFPTDKGHASVKCNKDAPKGTEYTLQRDSWSVSWVRDSERYPETHRVMPSCTKTKITLLDSAQLVTLASPAKAANSPLHLTVNGNIAAEWGIGAAPGSCSLAYASAQGVPTEPLVVLLNPAYLVDAAKGMGPGLVMGFNGDEDPVKIESGDWSRRAIVMPLLK